MVELVKSYLFKNPVLINELRKGFRANRLFIIQSIYIFIISAILYTVFLSTFATHYSQSGDTGKFIFMMLYNIQYFLLVFIVPSFSTGAISAEREKKTYDILRITLMEPWEIIWGKLSYSMVLVVLFLISTVPLMSIVFFFGGVSPKDILVSYLIILVSLFMLTGLSIYASAKSKNSKESTAATYAIIVFFGFFGGYSIPMFVLGFSSGLFPVERVDIFNLPVPLWLIFFLEIFFLGMLFVLASVDELKERFFRDNSSSIRIFFMIVLLLNVLGIAGGFWSYVKRGQFSIDQLNIFGAVITSLLLVFFAFLSFVFIYEPLHKRQRVTFKLKEFFLPKPLSTICYLLVITLVSYLLLIGVIGTLNQVLMLRLIYSAVLCCLAIFVLQILMFLFNLAFTKKAYTVFVAFALVVIFLVMPLVPFFYTMDNIGKGANETQPVYGFSYLSPVLANLSVFLFKAGINSTMTADPKLAQLFSVSGVPIWIITLPIFGLLSLVLLIVFIVVLSRRRGTNHSLNQKH